MRRHPGLYAAAGCATLVAAGMALLIGISWVLWIVHQAEQLGAGHR